MIKCIVYVCVFILFYFFADIIFYYTTKSLSLVGGSLFHSGLCLGGGGWLCVGVVGISGDSSCRCGLYSDLDSDS